MRLLLVCSSALLIAGCDPFFPSDCTVEETPAVKVTVRTDGVLPDSVSGVLSEGTHAEALDSYRSSAGTHTLTGGYERPGTYSLRVEAAGYRTWSRDGVRVRGGDCGPQTVRLTAELDPE